jgi:hypothetical protein
MQHQSHTLLKANKRFPKSFALRERQHLGWPPAMDDLIKLVKTYRVTTGIADRLRLAEDIFQRIGPELCAFVFSKVSHPAAEDAVQEVSKAVTVGLKSFKGGTEKEFWAWCYRIARNKLNDH